MKFSHTEDQRENQHLDILTDEENGMRIVVSRLGAELVSLARVNETGEWTGFFYRDNDLSAPPQGWANHATVMGYYLHRLKDGRSLYRGREIKGGNHGFLRSKTWHFAGTSVQGSGGSLDYQITPNDFAGGEMPFSKTELPGSIILELLDVPRRQFSYVDPPSGRWVSVDLTGVPYLTLWSDGGAFLCIEPCWGLTDHHQQRAFENKEGIQTIAPGRILRASFGMAPELASCD